MGIGGVRRQAGPLLAGGTEAKNRAERLQRVAIDAAKAAQDLLQEPRKQSGE